MNSTKTLPRTSTSPPPTNRQPPQRNKPKKDNDKPPKKPSNNNNNKLNHNTDSISDNTERTTNDSVLSSDHNDSGYETHEQHSSDHRENSTGSGDSIGEKSHRKIKPPLKDTGANRSNHPKTGPQGKPPRGQENGVSDTISHPSNLVDNDSSGYETISDKPEVGTGRERVKTARLRAKTAKTRIGADNSDNINAADGLGVNGESNFHSTPSSDIGSNTSLRSRGSDSSSISDKRVSFKEDLVDSDSKGAEPNPKSNRSSSSNNRKSSPSKEKSSPTKNSNMNGSGALSARDPVRNNGEVNNKSGFYSVREDPINSDYSNPHKEIPLARFPRDGVNASPGNNSIQSRHLDGSGSNNGDEVTVWQKVSTGSPGKDTSDTLSLGSVRSARLPERQGWSSIQDEYGFETTGRKFTRKITKNNLGSSTTLSSTNDGDDSEDVFNVVLRVRPLNDQEKSRRDKFVVDFPGDGQVAVNNSGTNRNFQFNAVFEPDAEQDDVFESSGIKKLVENSITGYSCTAFAFGQTGSGKTHTMTGPPAQFHQEGVTPDPSMYGLMQRSFKYLFQLLKRQGQNKTVRASYMEVYNEQVIDLLNNSHKRYLAVRWSKNRGFYVENLFTVECVEIDDVMAVLEEGE